MTGDSYTEFNLQIPTLSSLQALRAASAASFFSSPWQEDH